MRHSLPHLTLKSTTTSSRRLMLLVLMAIGGPLAADPVLHTWTGTQDGTSYELPGNWDPAGPPEPADNANFHLASTYTVTLSDDEGINDASFRFGNPTLNLDGNTYTIFQFRVGNDGFLTVTDGTLVQTRNGDFSGVGMTGGGDGEMLLTGPNTHLTAAYMRVGQQVRGVMRFEDGATGAVSSDANRFPIGRAGGGVGTVVISGVNMDNPLDPQRSSLTATGSQLVLASLSATTAPRGAVFVEDGGELITSGNLTMATANGQAIAVASGTDAEIKIGGVITVSSNTAGALESWLISRNEGFVSANGDISVHAAGRVAGNSTIQLLNEGILRNGGVVAPGDPTLSYTNLSVTRNYTSAIGSLTIDGDYAQQLVVGEDTFLGTLRIKVLSEALHDHLHITGDVTLAGTLDLVEFGSASLFLGDELQVLSWDGSLQGTFANIETFVLDEGLNWNFDRLYSEGIITVIPEPSTIAFVSTLLAAALLKLRRRILK